MLACLMKGPCVIRVSHGQVYTGIFNLLGLVPLMYACLLIPGARSANKVCACAWPTPRCFCRALRSHLHASACSGLSAPLSSQLACALSWHVHALISWSHVHCAPPPTQVPAWPFVAGSFAFGMFSLFPYFALWRPDRSQQLPPPASELEGWNKLVMKGAETPVLPAIIILGVLSQFYVIATAGKVVLL